MRIDATKENDDGKNTSKYKEYEVEFQYECACVCMCVCLCMCIGTAINFKYPLNDVVDVSNQNSHRQATTRLYVHGPYELLRVSSSSSSLIAEVLRKKP